MTDGAGSGGAAAGGPVLGGAASGGASSGGPVPGGAASGGVAGAAAGSVGEAAMEALELLARRGQTLAVAESLTGGLVAAELTSVPGASRAFRGSVTAYATELKHELLGVDGALLAERGAVDPEGAAQMARGVRRALGADWGVATTGVAGPDPQDGQPVGTVYVAVHGPDGAGNVIAPRLAGDRSSIREKTVHAAVNLLFGELIGTARAHDTEHDGGN